MVPQVLGGAGKDGAPSVFQSIKRGAGGAPSVHQIYFHEKIGKHIFEV